MGLIFWFLMGYVFNSSLTCGSGLCVIILVFKPRERSREGSFIKAARALGISGPAVSKQIKSLEALLNLVLLHRTTRAVTLAGAFMRTIRTGVSCH